MLKDRLVKTVDRLLAFLTVLISCLLVVCVCWQVFSRYVLGTPSTFTDELARFLFIWVGLIGAAYTTGKQRHLAIDLLTMKLQGRRKAFSQLVIQIAIAVFCALVMVYGGGGLMLRTLQTGQVSPALGVQMGYVYLAIPFSGVMMIFYSIVFGYEKLQVLFAPAKNIESTNHHSQVLDKN